MIEIKQKKTERAILIAVKTRFQSKEIIKEHLDELEELAATAGAEVVLKIVQERHGEEPAFYIGKGKAEELVQLVELNEIDLLIFDDDLSPVQIRNLERLLNRKIVDRSGLILDIFASGAKTKEARTQVELAQLQYLMPRLTRAWTHLSKQYGGIGTKGPGETQIETDRRIIKERIALLKEKLVKIESQRITQTEKRKDFVRISLVGYTNAGKSTLFNLLTKAGVPAEDKLFATLDSTTRGIELNKNLKVLLSDTVGFIRKLPHHLVASFKSTLNEVRESDIILQVIDVNHPYYEDHIEVVEETLKSLGCEKKTEIKVFNKVDVLSDKSRIEYITNKYKNSVILSAARGINISSLIEKISEIVNENMVYGKAILRIENSKEIAKIHSLAKVISEKYRENKVHISYSTDKSNAEKIKKMVETK
ncbi:MAG TPA: GTPase HflX [Ignavibacteriaceae bacterium]|jgi:GTP-binding protein HflX|nr:GTPase HflX [Ignavibacteriaceae bacterium]